MVPFLAHLVRAPFSASTYWLRLLKTATGQISGSDIGPVMTGQTSGLHRDKCLTGYDRARLTSDKI